MLKPRELIKLFAAKHPVIYDNVKDVAFSLAVVAAIMLILYVYAGTWPPMVSVIGVSMHPNMEDGDLVFIQGLARGAIQTYSNSTSTGYKSFNDYGDVIVYRPYGDPSSEWVIHRAVRWVEKGQVMYTDSLGDHVAPASGYITLGDNNNGIYDQKTPICYDQPVREEWILGVARLKLPYLGYLRHII
ncbi:S26 family signal peptidase [Methanocella conradii]|uniref:S26 family signal peptidase n=1 Tax=Methanocella conradii TaxID=1175444 RepID=UPI00157D7D7B|nr:S26 family signal peptidase [Methanocella conradii]